MRSRAWVTTSVLLSFLLLPLIVFAQASGFGQETQFEGTPGGSDLAGAIETVINFLLALAALVAAIFLIVGGVRYITSQGDEDQAERAKLTILYSVLGLIVIGLAAIIANFVTNIIAAV
jgi:uncharacterized membrane protein